MIILTRSINYSYIKRRGLERLGHTLLQYVHIHKPMFNYKTNYPRNSFGKNTLYVDFVGILMLNVKIPIVK